MLSKEKIMSLVSNRLLELILFPTEQCNFRCVYCYEDFSLGKMKRNTVEAIKKLIQQRAPTLDVLKISWFGGEPLAAKDIVYEISEFILQLQTVYPHLQYKSNMTTNAFLLRAATLDKLVKLGVTSYQISLDGTDKMHDQMRKRMHGQPTFQTIWNNLLAAKQTSLDFLIALRIHITPTNIADIYALVKKIKAIFSGDKRFFVFFKTIENLGGPNAGTFTVMQGKAKETILNQFYQLLGTEVAVKKNQDVGPYVCYAAQTNSFAIRANGKVAKCTVALADPRNFLGELKDDGTIEVASEKLALWVRGLRSQNLAELCCPLQKMPKLVQSLAAIPVVVK